MFVLVTQADGSARRFTWVTYAIVACLIAFFIQQHAANRIADKDRAVALAYLIENPYVEVEERFRGVIPLDYAQELRETFFQERRERGLALMSDHLMRRGQREFDELLESALATLELLPAWRFGIRGSDAPGLSWLVHPIVHETQFALILSVVLLLCLGIALEDGWGPILFGCFASVAVVTTGFASASVHYYDATGMPWFGSSGLIATLAGAYFVRSLRGSPRAFGAIPMPGWLLLPSWLAAEYIVVRGVSSPDEFVNAPAIVHGAGFGLGVAVGAVMLLLRVETKMIDRVQETPELVSNPVLERAMRAKEAGRAEEAFVLLRSEFRRAPRNLDVALALWDVSIQVGKASRVVEAILSVIEKDLQTGHASQAVAKWFAMTDEVAIPTARPQLLVRIGEALLDEGHPDAAIAALTRSVDQGKLLTSALAQRVVRIARDLDPELTRRAAEIALQDGQLGRVEREELSRLQGAGVSPLPEPEPAITDVDVDTGTNVELDDPGNRQSTVPDLAEDISALDPEALSIDDLEQEFSRNLDESEAQEFWNDPGLVDDLNDELEGEFGELDDAALAAVAMDSGIAGDTVTVVNVQSSIPEQEETKTEGSAPAATENGDVTATAVDIVPTQRSLRIRDAVPVTLESRSLVIEVEGGNKARLPYARVDALAAAAVEGLGEKPVVVIDLVINWLSAAEPLKVIRLRSDQFDPTQLVPGPANQLEALRKFLSDLIRVSNATPLPNFNAATGAPFQVFSGLADYQRDVLDGTEKSSEA
jgi:membrane associated rhomboid family serine protease